MVSQPLRTCCEWGRDIWDVKPIIFASLMQRRVIDYNFASATLLLIPAILGLGSFVLISVIPRWSVEALTRDVLYEHCVVSVFTACIEYLCLCSHFLCCCLECYEHRIEEPETFYLLRVLHHTDHLFSCFCAAARVTGSWLLTVSSPRGLGESQLFHPTPLVCRYPLISPRPSSQLPLPPDDPCCMARRSIVSLRSRATPRNLQPLLTL